MIDLFLFFIFGSVCRRLHTVEVCLSRNFNYDQAPILPPVSCLFFFVPGTHPIAAGE